MNKEAKIWKANVWIGAYENEPVTFFGESISKLRDSVSNWLVENQPERFGNAHPSYEITRRYNYSHASPHNPIRIQKAFDQEAITEGWIGVDGGEKDWSIYHRFNDIESVAMHFVNQSMIPRKGPDWKEIPEEAGSFPIHRIKAVKRIKNEMELNDHLQRGWYLLAIESSEDTDQGGQLKNPGVQFVIGHPEEDADLLFAPTSETHPRQVW